MHVIVGYFLLQGVDQNALIRTKFLSPKLTVYNSQFYCVLLISWTRACSTRIDPPRTMRPYQLTSNEKSLAVMYKPTELFAIIFVSGLSGEENIFFS